MYGVDRYGVRRTVTEQGTYFKGGMYVREYGYLTYVSTPYAEITEKKGHYKFLCFKEEQTPLICLSLML